MRIGIIIGRIGGVDGVALETEKWIEVLKRMGHEVFILSGQYQERRMDPLHETLVPEMSFFSPESYWAQKKAFFHPEKNNAGEILDHIDLYSKVIYKRLIEWVGANKIELLISENASALPSHLEMGLAIKNAVNKLQIPTITHDHDFAWERGDRYVSPFEEINKFVQETFPLRSAYNIHAVINTPAKETIKQKYGRDAVIVPNVMDFDQPFGQVNEKNRCLNEHLGYQCDDVMLFQITRIVRRKGIEVAIRLLHELDDERVKLVITGNYQDDADNTYYNELVNQIHELKLGNRVNFAYHIFHNKGLSSTNGGLTFSLSDAYANARACTYFSTYEGFGNAFVEAVLAKKPVFVNNYKPVYWPDIGSKGFKTVMLEDNQLTPEALNDTREVIFNEKVNKEIAEHNYKLGKLHFSFHTLEQKLDELLSLAGKL